MKIRLIICLAAAGLALTACTSTPNTGDNPATTTVIETTPAPEPTLTPDDMTDLVVELTWSQTSETDKDSMCDGIALLGTEWAAEQMQLGAGDQSVDWDRAAELVEAKCSER